MQRFFRMNIVIAGVCAALLAAGGGAQAAPVALVLDIAGAGGSAIEAFSEIEPGSKIDLGSGGRLEFLDYNSCRNVTVTGGKITFTQRKYLLRGGKVAEGGRGRCPKVVTLSKDARVGGVLLRSNPPTLRLKARPRFAFTGPNSASVERVRVLREGTEVVAISLMQPLLNWPESAAPLPVGAYMLEVLSKGGVAAKRVPFEVTAKGGKSQLTIVRMN